MPEPKKVHLRIGFWYFGKTYDNPLCASRSDDPQYTDDPKFITCGHCTNAILRATVRARELAHRQ